MFWKYELTLSLLKVSPSILKCPQQSGLELRSFISALGHHIFLAGQLEQAQKLRINDLGQSPDSLVCSWLWAHYLTCWASASHLSSGAGKPDLAGNLWRLNEIMEVRYLIQ